MLKYILQLTALFIFSLSITSCGSSGPDCNDEEELANFIATSSTDYITALALFNSDPSEASCERLLDAVNEYVESFEEIRECVPSSDRGEFDSFIADARTQLAGTDCN